jgi:YD repeat-containing protein
MRPFLDVWILNFEFSALLVLTLLLSASGAPAADEAPDAETRGHQLAQQLLDQRPTENFTNTGVLHIRPAQGPRTDIPLRCEIKVTATNWAMIYDAAVGAGEGVVITHADAQPNHYQFHAQNGKLVGLSGDQLMVPLAGSDFWIADLGQEFLHWPGQKLLRKEVKRSRGCSVLESTNPHPGASGYARVVSWIDTEQEGFVQAFAYDAHDQLLKEFYPKDVKKVAGQWQVGLMEMDNDQTHSTTRLEFNLDPAPDTPR